MILICSNHIRMNHLALQIANHRLWSTPAHRNKVRILFYGQSITEQDWWKRGHIVGTLCRLQNLSVVSRSAATDGMAPYTWDSVRKET